MYKLISRLLPALGGRFAAVTGSGRAVFLTDDNTLVERAHQELLDARIRFNEIDDPDLVDHAVYALAAAENRYRYLLRKRRQG